MLNERLLDQTCEAYSHSLSAPFFTVADLYRAFLEGCNWVTKKQHDKAVEAAEEYAANKDKDVIYTITNIEAAYRAGARVMLKVKEAENANVKKKINLTRAEWQKIAKLLSACHQLMTTADNLNKEVEQLLNKLDPFGSKVMSEWRDLAQRFKRLNRTTAKIFLDNTNEENYEWADEAEKIENAVRQIMKIDIYETKL